MEVSALKPAALAAPRGSGALLRLQSDERLIALTRRGQQAAFEVLVSRYHARLLSFCRHMLASREDAEDVLQEVFAAAFNAILADDREINVRPWLYRIARNRSLNHLRRASAIGVDSMDIHFADHGQSTGEKVLRRESFRQLIADVQQLPETQRTALLLREMDALSYEQIAHAMETTVPSVKSLLVRARISLAEAAEARLLSCEEVRQQLGESSEGLLKLEAPARRHLRDCERCRSFRKHLKTNNAALAAILPVGPVMLLKKLILSKFGSASAGGAHVAGAGGATAGVSAAGAGVGAGTAGGVSIGGLAGAGAGALATKAAATLAAAALVAGAVEVGHSGTHHHHRAAPAVSSYAASTHSEYVQPGAPAVVRSTPQPASPPLAHRLARATAAAHHARHHLLQHVPAAAAPAKPLADADAQAGTTPTGATPAPVDAGATQPATSATPVPAPPVTQVTTETTQLPTSTSTQTTTAPPTATTETPQPASPPPPTSTESTSSTATSSASTGSTTGSTGGEPGATDTTGGTASPPATGEDTPQLSGN